MTRTRDKCFKNQLEQKELLHSESTRELEQVLDSGIGGNFGFDPHQNDDEVAYAQFKEKAKFIPSEDSVRGRKIFCLLSGEGSVLRSRQDFPAGDDTPPIRPQEAGEVREGHEGLRRLYAQTD